MTAIQFRKIGQQFSEPNKFQDFGNTAISLVYFFIFVCSFHLSSLWVDFFMIIFMPLFWFRSFAQMHEAVHSQCAVNLKLNFVLGLFWGAFCFLPFVSWREIHLLHHRWAGNVHKDPTLAILRQYNYYSLGRRGVLRWVWRAWVPFLGFLQHFVFWRLAAEAIFKSRGRERYLHGMSLAVII